MPEPGGRQRTFELVPETLVPSRGFIRPMTSKAAKKAHQLATKGPKITKAEQRRLEREELERHRKEYERERAAAKAKAAREKKAEKAAAEKAARKKAGIPEPNKFVRPSQPTISLFVKSGSKRSWKDTDGAMEEITECEEDHDEANRAMMSRQIPEESVEKHSIDKDMKNTVSETAVDDWDEPPSKRTRRDRQISMNDADHAMNIRAINGQPNGEHQVKPVAKDNTGLLVASSRELEDEIESTKEKGTICPSKHSQKHQASNGNGNESETPEKSLEIARTEERILEAMPGNVIQSDRADKGVLIDDAQKQADRVMSSLNKQDVAPMASQKLQQPRDVVEDDEFSFEDDDILAEVINPPLKFGAADAENKLNSPEVLTVIPVKQALTNEDSEDEFGDFPSLSQSGILEQLVSSLESARKDESFCSMTGRGRVEAHKDPINPVDYPAQRKLEIGKQATKPQLQMCVQTPPVHTKALAKSTSKPINQQKTSFNGNAIVPKGPINDSQSRNRSSPRVVYGHKISQDHSIDRDGTVNQDHTIKHNHTVHQGHTVNRDHAITQNHTVKQGHTVNQDHTFNRAPPRPPKQNMKARTALQERSGNAMPPPKLPLNKIKPLFAPSFIKAPSTARLAAKYIPKPKPLSALPPSSTQAFLDSHFDDFFPSPSQQVRELEDDVNDLPSNTQIARELTEDLDDETAPCEAETSLGMFMCTQDLILSSQELSEIETPSRAAPKQAEAPGPRKRGRFFEEKEEDLVLAAIHESKMMAQQHQPKKVPLNNSFGTDYGDEDFEEEFFVQEKVGTVNNLSIHLSNLTGKAKEPSKRTMQRANSTVTDYGDDDFSGCSQELLAAIDVAEVSGSGEVGLC